MPAEPEGLAGLLDRRRRSDEAAGRDPALARGVAGLRAWQAQRLARTYADLAAQPRFAAAVQFFLNDVYGPQDFTRRDQDLARAARILERTLPRAGLEVLCAAIELDVLSRELDLAMVQALAGRALSAASYAQAYREVGHRRERERQISLVSELGARLDRTVQHAWAGRLLRLARAPAYAAGFNALQDFLERGFEAFRRLGGSQEFLATIERRERALLEQWFAATPEPPRPAEAGASLTHG